MIILQPDRILIAKQVACYAPSLKGDLLDVGSGRSRRYASVCTNVTSYKTMDVSDAGKPDIVGSAEAIPCDDASFDSVLCTQVLEHVPHPVKVIQEIYRVLKPGGQCLLTAPQWNELHEIPHDYFRYTCYGLRTLFEDAGFKVEHIEQRGGYHALRTQICIRYLIDRFHPYENRLAMLIIFPLSVLITKWGIWRDTLDTSAANRLHAIGWCVVARKP